MSLVLAAPPGLSPRRRRFPWKALLALAAAVIAIRLLLLDSLRVSSGSMEPLLHGDPARGDQVIVLRHWWQAAAPGRFDLVVFERDGESTRSDERVVVKRVAAVGGEAVRIAGGELFVRSPGGVEQPIVKSYAEFHDLLVPLWREPFDGATLARLVPLAAGTVQQSGRELLLDGSDDRVDCGIELRGTAAELDDGWLADDGTRVVGDERIGDACFAFALAAESATTAFVVDFSIAERRCQLAVNQVAGVWRLDLDVFDRSGSSAPRSCSGTSAGVRTGAAQRLEWWHIDGRLGAAVDGNVAFQEPLERRNDLLVPGSIVGVPTLRVRNGRARLSALEVSRDLHWTTPADASYACGSEPYEVPAGALFVLGDASEQSIDSRHYGAIDRASLRGRPVATWQPARRRRWLW